MSPKDRGNRGSCTKRRLLDLTEVEEEKRKRGGGGEGGDVFCISCLSEHVAVKHIVLFSLFDQLNLK